MPKKKQEDKIKISDDSRKQAPKSKPKDPAKIEGEVQISSKPRMDDQELTKRLGQLDRLAEQKPKAFTGEPNFKPVSGITGQPLSASAPRAFENTMGQPAQVVTPSQHFDSQYTPENIKGKEEARERKQPNLAPVFLEQLGKALAEGAGNAREGLVGLGESALGYEKAAPPQITPAGPPPDGSMVESHPLERLGLLSQPEPEPNKQSPVAAAAMEDVDPLEAMIRRRIESRSGAQRKEPGLADYIAIIASAFAPGANIQSQMAGARAITGEDREKDSERYDESNILRLLQLKQGREALKQRGAQQESKAAAALQPKQSDIRMARKFAEEDIDRQISHLNQLMAQPFPPPGMDLGDIEFQRNQLIAEKQKSRDLTAQTGSIPEYVDPLKILLQPKAQQ